MCIIDVGNNKETIIAKELAGSESAGVYWSDATRVGNLVFLSGIAAEDNHRKIIGTGNFAKQANFIFARMEKVLAQCNSTLSDVLKINAYLVRKKDFSKYNEIRRNWFKKVGFPASTTVIAAALAREEYLLEVEAVALSRKKS